ncbi:MAG: hypothetical protein ACRDHW_15380, partial [Ktedonobacteraceae bacterium]
MTTKPAVNFSPKRTVPLGPAPIHAPTRVASAPTPTPAFRHTTDPGTFAVPTQPLAPPPAMRRRKQRGSRGVVIAL